LAEALAERKIPLLEDDAYHDLRYEGEALPPISALAPNPSAIYTGTFSKIIAPGLRVGYLCAPPALVTRLTQLKQITDLHTGSLTQRIVFRFCESGCLEPQIERQCAVYGARRRALLAVLEEKWRGWAKWTRPQGGMFVLVTLPEELDTVKLLPKALEGGVVYVPATSFYPDGGGANVLRLNFVSATEERIGVGIGLLTQIIEQALSCPSE
jgi:2-aminoadipate transaminase